MQSEREQLLDLINAAWTTQAIAASVELRLADHLAAQPCDPSALARTTSSHPPSLARLMNALASLGIVVQRDDATFALTTMGELLRTEASDSLAWWSLLSGGRIWTSFGSLAASVRTGQSLRRRTGGSDDFTNFERDNAASEAFHRAMSNLTKPVADAFAAVLDLSGIARIVDVGGGHGQLLAAVLAANPAMHGVLFDLPHAIASARDELKAAGVQQRCDLVGGDFFRAIPAGADAYVLKSVLHDWDDERCAAILRECARAMRAATARLFVVERIRPERFSPTPLDRAIARSDLNMLVSLGGRERTTQEYNDLFAAAGLRASRTLLLRNEFSVIEAALH